MTNFEIFKHYPEFASFSELAFTAEKVCSSNPKACAIYCFQTLDCAVKWMYSVDNKLILPEDSSFFDLVSSNEFKSIVDPSLIQRIEYIHRLGTTAEHKGKRISVEQTSLCLENLFVLLDFIAFCYSEHYEKKEFDPSLLAKECPEEELPKAENVFKLSAPVVANDRVREIFSSRRERQLRNYIPRTLDISEYKTRKLYIDTMLLDAGWIEGQNWINEYELEGMPNQAGLGYADYVLFGDDGLILAVIEAKKTCVSVEKGRQQAKLYADLIEKKQNFRPVVFLTNGFDTRLIDNQYPERKVACIYSKRDLEKQFNLKKTRQKLDNISVDKGIAGRYYQEAAIKAVCEDFDKHNRRKALLVMATGSGKTRTVIALCKVLMEKGWIKNILFLADRTPLVKQAKKAFTKFIPNLSATNICEERNGYDSRCILSTYQTMINCIDKVEDEDGKIFSCGHFDLVICDEAHRSIYNKYKDIFNYFDAPLIGLTATPKDEIDKNTYEIFELANGMPTYGYELAQAVTDGFLVDYLSVETTLKFVQEGITYDELSEEDKEEYEETFKDEDGNIPEKIEASALNEWIFNEDTISKVLNILMTEGLRVDYGNKIGKTIIFAKNHTHAEKIFEVFGKQYPNLVDYAKVIDNYMTYAQSAIDDFSEANKLPQIAISVDMLDTGIDVPEILNLVFFKKVLSKAKFWQMIGRGTRLCPGLLDGKDKDKFYIFDFCGNFEFFRLNKGKASANAMALQGAIFLLKARIAEKLQALEYQTKELIAFRERLVNDMVSKVQALNRDNFAVKQHLRYVNYYSEKKNYTTLTFEDLKILKEEIVPLVEPEQDEIKALRFDDLLYGIELAYLAKSPWNSSRKDLINNVQEIAKIANVPEIIAHAEIIHKILHTDFLDTAGINEFECIREEIRNLLKYIPNNSVKYNTNFEDDILNTEIHEAELEKVYFANYKEKAESYIRAHQDNEAISKLKNNIPLTDDDIKELERILWKEIGTKEEYSAEYGEKPLGILVRSIVGLDMNAAKEAFSNYLTKANFNSRQIYFLNQIIEYIVQNGTMSDFSVLQETPFTDQGSIAEVFDMKAWAGIRNTIERINANAIIA